MNHQKHNKFPVLNISTVHNKIGEAQIENFRQSVQCGSPFSNYPTEANKTSIHSCILRLSIVEEYILYLERNWNIVGLGAVHKLYKAIFAFLRPPTLL